MSTPEQLELLLKEISVAPRVTYESILNNIKSEHFFTAEQGVVGTYNGGLEDNTIIPDRESLSVFTFCVLVLQNGFIVTGESACAYPENFNPQLGMEIAKKDAVSKIGALMGYELKSIQNREKNSTVYSRVCEEYTQLHDKAMKLEACIESERFQSFDADVQRLLKLQHGAMTSYREVLLERLSQMKPE